MVQPQGSSTWSLRSLEAIERLKRELLLTYNSLTEHLLLVEAETASAASVSLNDPLTPTADGLVNLHSSAKLPDRRIDVLDRLGFDKNKEGACDRLESLIPYLDKIVADKTAAAWLQRAGMWLEHDIQTLSEELVELKDCAGEESAMVIALVDHFLKAEKSCPSDCITSSVEEVDAASTKVEREPRDVIWRRIGSGVSQSHRRCQWRRRMRE